MRARRRGRRLAGEDAAGDQARKIRLTGTTSCDAEANGAVVLELERRLRVTEPVIKFITVRIDEEEKRLAKVKAARGTRRKVTSEPMRHRPQPKPLERPVSPLRRMRENREQGTEGARE